MTGFTNLNDNVLEEDWDRCFNLNVKCHLFLMQAVKQHLEETEGAFITTASAAGVKPGGSSLVSPAQPQQLPWARFISGTKHLHQGRRRSNAHPLRAPGTLHPQFFLEYPVRSIQL